jgi:hypothetical protein
MAYLEFSASGVSIGTSLTKIYETLVGSSPDLADYKVCGLEISNDGGTAFTQIEIRAKPHSTANEQVLLTLSTDYLEPLKHPLLFASDSIYTLAGGSKGMLEFWTLGYRVISFWAKVGSGTTTAGCKGILK